MSFPVSFTPSKLYLGSHTHSGRKIADARTVVEAENLFARLKQRCRPDVFAYNSFITVCVRSGDLMKARSIYRDMKGSAIAPTVVTYNVLIHGSIQNNEIDRAFDYLAKLKKHVQPTASSYQPFINYYVQKSDVEAVFELLEDMIRQRVEFTPSTHAKFFALLQNRGSVDGLLRLFDLLGRADAEPSAKNFAFSVGICTGDDRETVIELLSMMRRYKWQYSAHHYVAIIKYFMDIDELDTAHEFVRELMEKHADLDEFSYVKVMIFYIKYGDSDRAFEVFEEMLDRRIEPNLQTFRQLFDDCAKRQELTRPSRVLDYMNAHGIRPDSFCYAGLIKSCVAREEIGMALDLVEEMVELGIALEPRALTSLIEYMMDSGNMDEAMEIFSRGYAKELERAREVRTLDVHGFSHDCAWVYLRCFLEKYTDAQPFIVITGIGKHSRMELFAMREFLREKSCYLSPWTCQTDAFNTGILQFSYKIY